MERPLQMVISPVSNKSNSLYEQIYNAHVWCCRFPPAVSCSPHWLPDKKKSNLRCEFQLARVKSGSNSLSLDGGVLLDGLQFMVHAEVRWFKRENP